ncbi:type I polyketide synthase [Streptomyces sp. NRRL S-646]|uniref:type I polyketide synthase n=1 Tax=Streptomyces sp. NRRL S-646 TaxID=1463917 RepID=UPI000689384C|nr:type I polyketide synthase [Streptomyces sp. NRRL S-646]
MTDRPAITGTTNALSHDTAVHGHGPDDTAPDDADTGIDLDPDLDPDLDLDLDLDENSIAIVGMACRYPGAADVHELWENLKKGIDGISRFTEDELTAAGVPESVVRHPDHVPVRGVLDGGDRFDWAFFGYSPGEAARMDPQHRVFLETAFTALQDAGLDTRRADTWIGVFAGCDVPTADFVTEDGLATEMIARDKDFLATRVAYKLGLRGPAMTVQTACSTSLVATHTAVQSLLGHDCDVALAGGVSLRLPAGTGYVYQRGGIASPEGRCRPFDAGADGTVPGSGVGVVVLKRLADAVRDGDRIVAVIRGSAVNNDGSEKIGYTTPSVTGQREVIALAHERAGIGSHDVSYVETHGTGTAVGDPVELAGLSAAFGDTSDGRPRSRRCVLGAVKSNLGHTGSAAGVAGLIKTALMLRHRTLVPNAHFAEPSKELAESVFEVCRETGPWPGDGPLFAGVSAFGVGGTNAHMVLESPPVLPWREPEPEVPRLLCLSAPAEAGLDRLRTSLAERLTADADAPRLDDTAWTLARARQHFPLRTAHVVTGRETVREALLGPVAAVRAAEAPERAGIVLTMPGQSGLRPGSGRAAHALLPRFRTAFTRVREETLDRFAIDIAKVLDPGTPPEWLADTRNQQLVLFALGHALAEQLAAWDIRPTALLGNSSGEYVAAALAGVWDLSDAIGIVQARGEAMWAAPEGRMLAVSLTAAEAAALVAEHDGIGLAVDSPGHVVVSGRVEAAEAFAAELERRDVKFTVLRSPLASHSDVMAGAADVLRPVLARVPAQAPTVPVVSNLTGSWLTAEQAADPEYWAAHLCTTVRLSEGIGTLLDGPSALVLELGPGDSMTRYVRAHPAWSSADRTAAPTLGRAPGQEQESLLEAVGRVWERGLRPDWRDLFPGPQPRRTALPPVPLDSRPLPLHKPRHAARSAVPSGTGPLVTHRRWSRAGTTTEAVHGAVLVVSDAAEPGVGALVDAVSAPDAYRERAGWAQADADGFFDGPGGEDGRDRQAAVVAVLPPAEGTQVPDAVRLLAERTGERDVPLVLVARGVVDVLGEGEATRADAAELTAWVTRQARTGGRIQLLDLGPVDAGPVGRPRGRAGTALFAWRGAHWWGLDRETVAPDDVAGPPAPKRPAIGADGVPGAARLVRDLAAAGTPVGVFVAASPDRPVLGGVAAALPPVPAWDRTDRLSARPRVRAALDRYCAGLAGRHLLDTVRLAPGDLVADDGLRRRLDPASLLPRHTGMLIGMLAAEGWLTSAPGGAWRLGPDFAERVEQALRPGAELDEVPGLRRLLDHCAAALPEVLTGRRTPVGVLYPDGRPDLMREHLRDNRVVVGDASACLDSLVAAVHALPVDAGRPLNILEVGAGQADFASRLLDGWDARDHVAYHVTDISPLLVRRARERYADARAMAFSTYDLTRAPEEQGLVPGVYDLVVAYNSLHVAHDVRQAAGHLGRLLGPTGSLCLVEITRPGRWEHFVWGLAPGWWDFDDDLRTDSVHLDRATWHTALRDTGLTEVTCLPGTDEADHTLLIASRAGATDPRGGADLVRELATRAEESGCDAVVHLVGPDALGSPEPALGTPAALRHAATAERPVLAVTVDDAGPDPAQPMAERWRRAFDPPTDGPLRHVEVPLLDTAVLATLPALAVGTTLPPTVRLERPATPAPSPTRPEPTPTTPQPTGGAPAPGRPAVVVTEHDDPAAEALAEVWRDLLGVPSAAHGDDFFALGGDSLMAVHFVSRVKDRTGVALPLTAFAETARFGDLSALLRRATPAPREERETVPGLMVLRGTGTRTPLFLAAPAVGSSLCYRGLARRLGDDQPVYGIESPLLDGGLPGRARIEDIAEHHVDLLRRARPEGPYVVGGWSVGAMVAHEMARRLTAAGSPVEAVLGIDGYVIDTRGRPQYTLPELLLQGVRYQAQAALGRRPDIERMGGDQRVYRRAFQRNVSAMLRYTPRPVTADAMVFRAGADAAALARVRQRIGALYEGEVDVRAASGSHFTVLNDPHVERVATEFLQRRG